MYLRYELKWAEGWNKGGTEENFPIRIERLEADMWTQNTPNITYSKSANQYALTLEDNSFNDTLLRPAFRTQQCTPTAQEANVVNCCVISKQNRQRNIHLHNAFISCMNLNSDVCKIDRVSVRFLFWVPAVIFFFEGKGGMGLSDFRFPRRWIWKRLSAGLWNLVVTSNHVPSFFRPSLLKIEAQPISCQPNYRRFSHKNTVNVVWFSVWRMTNKADVFRCLLTASTAVCVCQWQHNLARIAYEIGYKL